MASQKEDQSKKKPAIAANYFPETLFKKDLFQNYDDKDFIENLTYRLLNESKKAPVSEQANFCVLFEELFDKSIEQLKGLQVEVICFFACLSFF